MTFDRRHIKQAENLIEIQKHNQKKFYEKNHFYVFKHISEERKNEICEKAFLWKEDNKQFVGNNLLNHLYLTLNKCAHILKLEYGDFYF